MDEKTLFTFWKKYVDSKYLYRTVSEEYTSELKTHGFNPRNDPFRKHKKEIFRLFDICLKLHKKGFIMMRWWGEPVDQTNVISTTKKDLNNDFIDFTPNFKQTIDYYLKLKGGALANTIFIFTEELLMKKPPLTNSEVKLIIKLNEWSKKRRSFKNKVIAIPASSRYFETAFFQNFQGKYLESPFGTFGHFKKIVSKNGLATYYLYLTGKKLFYLRTTTPIPNSEIRKISNKI